MGETLRGAAAGAAPPLLAVRHYRETRSVRMLVFDGEDGRATALALDLQARLGGSASTARSAGRGSRASPCSTSSGRRASPGKPVRTRGQSVPSALYHSVLQSGRSAVRGANPWRWG